MATTLGDATASITPARRDARSGWRDPRLWVGVLIVAASVLAGSRVLAAADDTQRVWAAAHDMGTGQRVTHDDLVITRVHFDDAGDQDDYFAADAPLPSDLQLTRGIGAGELLARSGIGSTTAGGLLELPIAVDPDQVPASVHDGAVVDVYVVAAPSATPGGGAHLAHGGPAIAQATVVDAPREDSSFGGIGKRQLVLAVPDQEAAAFFGLLSHYDDPVLTVVRRS